MVFINALQSELKDESVFYMYYWLYSFIITTV